MTRERKKHQHKLEKKSALIVVRLGKYKTLSKHTTEWMEKLSKAFRRFNFCSRGVLTTDTLYTQRHTLNKYLLLAIDGLFGDVSRVIVCTCVVS